MSGRRGPTPMLAGLYGPDQIVQTNNQPARNATYEVFDADGITPSPVYSDAARTTTLTQPLAADVNGMFSFWAEPGQHTLLVRGVSATVLVPVNPADDVLRQVAVFSAPGVQTVAVGSARYYLDADYELQIVRASVGVAPTGQALVVNPKRNGVAIYGAGERPSIPVGAFTDLGGTPTLIDT